MKSNSEPLLGGEFYIRDTFNILRLENIYKVTPLQTVGSKSGWPFLLSDLIDKF